MKFRALLYALFLAIIAIASRLDTNDRFFVLSFLCFASFAIAVNAWRKE